MGKSSKLIGGTRKSGLEDFLSISQLLLLVIKVSMFIIYYLASYLQYIILVAAKMRREQKTLSMLFLWCEICECKKSAKLIKLMRALTVIFMALFFIHRFLFRFSKCTNKTIRRFNFQFLPAFGSPLTCQVYAYSIWY